MERTNFLKAILAIPLAIVGGVKLVEADHKPEMKYTLSHLNHRLEHTHDNADCYVFDHRHNCKVPANPGIYFYLLHKTPGKNVSVEGINIHGKQCGSNIFVVGDMVPIPTYFKKVTRMCDQVPIPGMNEYSYTCREFVSA